MKEFIEKYKKKFSEELMDYCAPFWLKYGVDEKYGGVKNCIDKNGEVYSTDKAVWMQGRTAWTYSRLCNQFGYKKEWADFAKSCLKFEKEHCIDKTDERMYFTVTCDGKPLRKRRYWFSETFYIIANIEYYKLSGEKEYLDEARKYYDFVYGIYTDPASDPYKITPKVIVETRSLKSLAQPMILLNVSRNMLDIDAERGALYAENIDKLIMEIKRFHKPELKAMLEAVGAKDNGFSPEYSEARIVNPGHDLECCWFLLEEAIRLNDQSLVEFVEMVYEQAINIGWDEKYGGILYFKDVLGKPVEAYEHDMKLWWPHNEAIIASLMLYAKTGKEKYKDWFIKFTDYAFDHFSDHSTGEWLGYLRRDGVPTEPAVKGHTYKGAFHVMRMLIKCLDVLENM